MSVVRPFMAVRPKNGLEDKIAALPYDVYNRKEAKEAVKDNPLSFLNIDRAETNLSDDVDTYDPVVYKKARELYENMLNEGNFVKDSKPCFYLYEQTMDGRTQTGLVCCASVDEYVNGTIKKHENTRADKELDRINHVDTVNAQTGPIFLACKSNSVVNALFATVKSGAPYCDFVSDDGIRHKAWLIEEEPLISAFEEAFLKIDNLYIADGHHRCASAAKVSLMRREKAASFDKDAEYNSFLSVIFPENELMIMDYNRVVKDLNGLSVDDFLSKIKASFDVEEITLSDEKPTKKGDVYMFLADKEYKVSLKKEFLSNDPIKKLDVSVLQDYLLEPVLGISDPKTDKRIDFVGGIRGVKELRRRINEDCVVAFAMYPTQMSELFDVADAGLLMPPKSTWFEPKLRSGLFIHELV